METLLTPRDLQDRLALKRSAVWKLLVTGSIPSIIVTDGMRRRTFRVRPSELERWLKAREVRG